MQLKLVSLLGLVVLIAVAWGLSSDRRRFPWRTVAWGLGLQFLFASSYRENHPGAHGLRAANAAVGRLVGFANEGARMVFGPLADAAEALRGPFGGNAFIFAITVTATIILVAAVSSSSTTGA